MRVFITGLSGFVGSHLADYIRSNIQNVEIHGLVRPGGAPGHLFPATDQLHLHFGDLLDQNSLLKALEECRPDRIFHLAGFSSTHYSFDLPALAVKVNTMGTLNLLQAVRESRLNPTIIIASCGEIYGLAFADELPLKETAIFRPLNPLAVSKAAQDLLGFQFFKSFGLKIIRVRLFDLVGPRQPDFYFLSGVARQIAEIEKKKATPVIKVFNPEVKRDCTDVRDLVRALWLIAEKSEPGEVYNLGSGLAWSRSELVKMMVGLTRAKIVINTEENHSLRFPEPPILLADISRMMKLTGWKPQINLKQSLLDLLNYWREVIK